MNITSPRFWELFKMSVIRNIERELIKAKELAEQSVHKRTVSTNMSHETVLQ
jgi:hypothetical protein